MDILKYIEELALTVGAKNNGRWDGPGNGLRIEGMLNHITGDTTLIATYVGSRGGHLILNPVKIQLPKDCPSIIRITRNLPDTVDNEYFNLYSFLEAGNKLELIYE